MLQWIANLFRRGAEDLPCVKTLAADGLQVQVLAQMRNCGHTGYIFEICCHHEQRHEWIPVGLLADVDVFPAIGLLIEAAKFVDAERTKQFVPTLLDD